MKAQIKTIQQLRVIKGISIADIGKVVSRQTYYNLIQGKHKYKLTDTTLEKLCDLFEVSEDDFKRLLSNTVPKK